MSGNLLSQSFGESYTSPPAGSVGKVIQHKPGVKYRFVKNDSGGDLLKNEALKFKSRANFTVEKTAAALDKPCGVVPDEVKAFKIPDGDHFYMQIAGESKVIHDGGTATVIGDWVAPNVTTAGRVVGRSPAAQDDEIPQNVLGRALAVETGAGNVFAIQLFESNLEEGGF